VIIKKLDYPKPLVRFPTEARRTLKRRALSKRGGYDRRKKVTPWKVLASAVR